MAQVQSFDAHAGGYARSTHHQGLNQLAFYTGPIQQWNYGNAATLKIRKQRGNPTNHAHLRKAMSIAPDRIIEAITHNVDGVFGEERGINFGQNLLAKILDR